MNSVQAKVNRAEQRTVNHELFLKLLAYKFIDIEARSRRCNFVIHGLADSKNKRLDDKLQECMWNEMGIDSGDLFVHRTHRLVRYTRINRDKIPITPKGL